MQKPAKKAPNSNLTDRVSAARLSRVASPLWRPYRVVSGHPRSYPSPRRPAGVGGGGGDGVGGIAVAHLAGEKMPQSSSNAIIFHSTFLRNLRIFIN